MNNDNITYNQISIMSATPYRTKAKNPRKSSLFRSVLFWVPDVNYKNFSYEDIVLKGWLHKNNTIKGELHWRPFILASSTANVLAFSDAITGGTIRFKVQDKHNIYKIVKRLYKPRAKIFC